MAKTKSKMPKERVSAGRVALLCWENIANGESFNSFSINKTVLKRNKADRSKFTGQVMSLNGLTKNDLVNLKQAITEMTDRVTGLKDLEECEAE